MQAWLGLTPDSSKVKNGDQYGGELPPINDNYGHIAEYFAELGKIQTSFNGLVPLPFTEIQAWSNSMNIRLKPVEVDIIRAMSEHYCYIGNDKDAECPIQTDEQRQTINTANIASWLAVSNKQ